MVSRKSRRELCKDFIVSACLAGDNCAHDGRNRLRRRIGRMVAEGRAVAICPEVAGGASVPRETCEISGGDGNDVLMRKACVLTRSGQDVTRTLVNGAKKALQIARRLGIREAVLKSGSPSCGCGRIYDGTFTGSLKRGDGVTAALLRASGIKVYTEKGFDGR